MRTLIDQAMDLEQGHVTSRELVEAALARIADPDGEGRRTFLAVEAEAARASADAMDLLRRAGRAPGPYAGLPLSVKDLFDVAGETTAAGSRVLQGAAPAGRHAPVVARMLAAGFVPVGRTNMVEFAFSGLGMNPHWGTPQAPWERGIDGGRVPGGSSSGAAVSVADGMAAVALGTDTGGSCRIPAAFCGIVGYKPTARRVPTDGVLPLSHTLDSVGPLAASVRCCAAVDAILAGEAPRAMPSLPLAGLRFAVPTSVVLEGMDDAVAFAFDRALSLLAGAGAQVTRAAFPQLERILRANATGGFTAPEAYAWHRDLLRAQADAYDPLVRVRIERGEAMRAHEYIELLGARAAIIASMDTAAAPFDALLMPTAPVVPPRIEAMRDPAEYTRVNALVLRNPALANFLDRCSISLPMHQGDEPPAGLMLVGQTGGDHQLFSVAAAVEAALPRQ